MKNIDLERPLRLETSRVWRTYTGGELLDELYGTKSENDHFPEIWITSAVAARNTGREQIKDEGLSYVCGEDISFKELLESETEKCLGPAHTEKYGATLGVLAKLIDASERLTVQVHPDKDKAERLFHSPFGKTECWYILGGRSINGEAPCIYLGFREGITREKWERYFEEQNISGMLDCLHRFEVSPGDSYLVTGGVPHAIGAGCLLSEVQEPTDYSIRPERITPGGFHISDFMCHQGIGFKDMFECFTYEGLPREQVQARWKLPLSLSEQAEGHRVDAVVTYEDTPCFRMDILRVDGAWNSPPPGVFSGMFVYSGSGRLMCKGKTQELAPGMQFFVPYSCGPFSIEAEPGKELEILWIFGPQLDQEV